MNDDGAIAIVTHSGVINIIYYIVKKLKWSNKFKSLSKDYEMSKIMLSADLPDNLTYPDTFKLYFKTVKEFRNYRYISAIHESMLDADN